MNTSVENRTLNSVTKNKALKIILIVVFALAIIGNGVQGYFIWKKVKAYHSLEAIIKNKSNCDECPAQVESPTESTPTPTTPTPRSKSSGSDSDSDTSQDPVATPEPVIPPPPPPAD